MNAQARSLKLLPHGPLLDSFDSLRDDDTMDEDARRVNAVRIELARLDELLDLGDADLSRRRRHRIEVPRGLPVDEVAEAVGLLRGGEREVAHDAALHHLHAAAQLA